MEKKSTGSKIVAIHQPNYIPWLGFFHKMLSADIFVYLDTVQYPRGQSFAARNRIKTPNGILFLTIPISIEKGHHGKVRYVDVDFAGNLWKEKHLKSLEMNYKKAPYFEEIFSMYKKQMERFDKFVDLNINLIEAFAEYLQINVSRIRLSDILKNNHHKTELIVNICKKLNANTYLSGTGAGKEYIDEEILDQNKIQLLFDQFKHPQYPQLWGTFEPDLSIIDLLFNCGTDSKEILHGERVAMAQNSDKEYFVHESSYVDDNVQIGKGTKIWHFCHILKNTTIGEKCIVGQNVMIGPKVKIANNVKIQNNVSVYEGVELEDDVFCGPSMVFTNVINPRSAIERKSEFKKTLVKKGATLGANTTIICGITIGRYALVGAGAVVNKNVAAHALVVGIPAKQMGWVCECGVTLKEINNESNLICPGCYKKYQQQNNSIELIANQ
jgi:UDP-2-acetamido-3-amino-2,3-dideoxy-glucuronate N-acetyltransferase